MPKIFQAKVIYQILNNNYSDEVPLDLHRWMCPGRKISNFDRWYMAVPIKAAILFQYPVLRRLKEGLVPWAPEDGIPLQSLPELEVEWDYNDRPQPMQKGVIECN